MERYLIGTRNTAPTELLATDDWIDASMISDRITVPDAPSYIVDTMAGKTFCVGLACDHRAAMNQKPD